MVQGPLVAYNKDAKGTPFSAKRTLHHHCQWEISNKMRKLTFETDQNDTMEVMGDLVQLSRGRGEVVEIILGQKPSTSLLVTNGVGAIGKVGHYIEPSKVE